MKYNVIWKNKWHHFENKNVSLDEAFKWAKSTTNAYGDAVSTVIVITAKEN
jgi:hypothetical protein